MQPAKATMADLEQMGAESPSPELLCLTLAQILRVRRNEVALLRLEKNCLRFVFPTELRAAGALPLSGPAVAARTASARSSLLSNSFARVRHASLFETVKLGGVEADEPGSQQLPIQKIHVGPRRRLGRACRWSRASLSEGHGSNAGGRRLHQRRPQTPRESGSDSGGIALHAGRRRVLAVCRHSGSYHGIVLAFAASKSPGQRRSLTPTPTGN